MPVTRLSEIVALMERKPAGSEVKLNYLDGRGSVWCAKEILAIEAERFRARGEDPEVDVSAVRQPLLYAPRSRASRLGLRLTLGLSLWVALALIDYFTIRSSAFAVIAFVAIGVWVTGWRG